MRRTILVKNLFLVINYQISLTSFLFSKIDLVFANSASSHVSCKKGVDKPLFYSNNIFKAFFEFFANKWGWQPFSSMSYEKGIDRPIFWNSL